MHSQGWRLRAALALLAACAALQADARTLSQAAVGAPATTPVTYVELHVRVAKGAPDCYERDIILVNGQFQPAIEVQQDSILQVNVFNELPDDYPLVSEGLSIHWHGFDMRGREWLDGTAHVTQCPIPAGQNFTYEFQVLESAGSYMWHDHNTALRADGLQGPLIVRAAPGAPEPYQYDEERTLFLSDWFHGEGNALAMNLNRPFDFTKATNTTGTWNWVSLPQAVLLNGKAVAQDCSIIGGLGPLAGQATVEPVCNVTALSIPPGRSALQPFAAPTNPGCSHTNFTIASGKTYRFRLISATSLLYTTVCFERHNVTIVAADAIPTQPLEVDCVDINSGQRYDVILRADQPEDNYWISVHPQYRIGSPMGYGVLNYQGAPNNTLPSARTHRLVQAGTIPPWTADEIGEILAADFLVNPPAAQVSTASVGGQHPRLGSVVLPVNATSLKVPPKTRTIYVNTSQPLLQANGMLRWALNNVAHASTPSCGTTLGQVWGDNAFFSKNAVAAGSPLLRDGVSGITGIQSGSGPAQVWLNGELAPSGPATGQHVIQLALGEVVELVLQARPANNLGGDYRPTAPGAGAFRNGTEQHAMHLHGHHFWVLGDGVGVYNPAVHEADLNTDNPPFRDSYTLLQNGWAVIRFKADNPGTWLYHCHQFWHQYIGMSLLFAEGVEAISAPPANLPACPANCTYNFAPWSIPFVRATFGSTGHNVPI